MKNNKMITSGIELLLIMVSIIVAAYAWLNYQTNAKPTDLTMTTKSFIDLLISTDDGVSWKNKSELNIPTNFIFGNDVTSNGINFYVKNLEADDGTPISFKNAVVNDDYLEFKVQFKSTTRCAVFLEENSYVLPKSGTTEEELIGEHVERPSSSGDFSRDLIAGAVRVSIVADEEVNGKYYPTNHPSLIWAPNPNINIGCHNDVCNPSLKSVEKQNYQYVDVNAETFYTQKYPQNLRDTIHASYKENNSNGDPMLLYIEEPDKVYSATIRIWIEGNDREAITGLMGGEFIINLSFIAFNKQINADTVPCTNSNIDTCYNDTMEYSKDNGLTWHDDELVHDYGETIYIRYKQTVDKFESNYIELSF